MSYSHEERARSRSTIRRLQSLAVSAKNAAAHGIILPSQTEQAIYGLTQSQDRNSQVNALNGLSERLRSEHLRKLRPLAKDEFNAFCEYVNPDEPPESPWHIFLTNTLQKIECEPGNEHFVLNCPPGHAKDLVLDTPIFTPNGWTTMGEIQIGDELFDDTGQICHVTWKSPVYVDQKVYRVTTDCGDEIVCGAGHEWPVVLDRKPKRPASIRGRNKKQNPHPYTIHTTEYLARKRSKRPMIIRAGVLEFPEADLPLDPYILGVWLGDGSKGANVIWSSEQDASEWMRPEFERLGFKTKDKSDPQSFGVNGLCKLLTKIGVKNNKHIPREYICTSSDQRLALLQGLVDTDGTVAPDGQIMFCNKDRDLIDEVQFLVRSLGVKATVCESRAVFNGVDYGPVWRVSFYKKDGARMPRKRDLCRDAFRTTNTYITVEPAGNADTQCIEVSSPNHLFLAGRSMTPTHNPLEVTTPILMSDGTWKKLSDIKVGDEVITHMGRARQVTAVHEQGMLDVLSLKTKHGREIITAPDHSFLMREKHGTRSSPTMFKRADALRVGNLLQMAPAADIPKAYGKSKRDFELAAYINSSASRTYNPNRKKTKLYRNVFLLSRAQASAERMSRVLNGLRIRHSFRFSECEKLFYIRINTRGGDRLSKIYDLDAKAIDRRIPDFVFKGSNKEVAAYVEAYVAMRGEMPAKFKLPHLNVSFRSYGMAQDFQRLLARFGVPCSVEQRRTSGALVVMKHDQLHFFLQHFTYRGVHVERMQAALDIQRANVKYRGPFIAGDFVQAIKPYGQAECRCLTVEQDHTFIADGVVVHNSTYASRLFVAWRLGRRPSDKIIGGGHSQRFVENEFSKKIRDLVGGQAYHEIFPALTIDHATRAKDQWEIAGTGGKYVARGVGQAVHGFRANFACIDDPYAKVEDAESATIREKVKTWFFNDIDSRLLPGATVFLIMTRFHEDDLTGSVIEANKELLPHMQFKIIEAPAICYDQETDPLNREVGECLWSYYSLDYFQAKRAVWSYQRFSLVFQQLTSAADTDSIASKFKFYLRAPHATTEAVQDARNKNQFDQASGAPVVNKRDYYRRIITSVDTATKDTQRADYTVIQIWAETFDRKYYLLDQKRGKWELPALISQINKVSRYHGVDAILVEDKGNGSAYIQDQGSTEFQRRKAPAPVIAIQVPSNQGKAFRFDEVTPMIEAGEVYIPQDADWIDLYIREIGQFPSGAKDDQVDATSQFLRWVKSKRGGKYGSRKVSSMG